ncbi:MAG TPA: hypothetical protein VL242_11365 [Sorangium sp.]|nr:hypothetical protein [Sorangium sp.]
MPRSQQSALTELDPPTTQHVAFSPQISTEPRGSQHFCEPKATWSGVSRSSGSGMIPR